MLWEVWVAVPAAVWSVHRQLSIFSDVLNAGVTSIAFVSSFASLPNVM